MRSFLSRTIHLTPRLDAPVLTMATVFGITGSLATQGCNSVFGLEELGIAPPDAAANDSGGSGAAADVDAAQPGDSADVAQDVPADSPLEVTGDEEMAPPDGPPEGGTLVVRGRVGVVDDSFQPLARSTVYIGAQSAVTAADGTFSIAGVLPPYDATVVLDKTLGDKAALFVGLTRANPTLMFYAAVSTTHYSAQASGSLSGGAGFPNPADTKSTVVFDGPNGAGRIPVDPGPGYGPLDIVWRGGASSVTGSLRALQWQTDGNGVAIAYQGFGSILFTSNDQGVAANQDIALDAVTASDISGSVVLPGGYSLLAKRMFAYSSASRRPAATFEVVTDKTASTSFAYKSPNLPGAAVGILAYAGESSRRAAVYQSGLMPNATGVSLTVPEAPSLALPGNGAINVDQTTQFTWTPFDGGIHWLELWCDSPELEVYVLTKEASAKLPDLARAGLGLPKSVTCHWNVFAWAPFAAVDDAASPSGFGRTATGASAPRTDGTNGYSETRAFVTSP